MEILFYLFIIISGLAGLAIGWLWASSRFKAGTVSRSEFENLQYEFNQTSKELEVQKNNLQNALQNAAKLEDKNRNLDEELQRLRQMLAASKANLDAFEEKVHELKSQNENLNKEKTQFANEFHEANKRNSGLWAENKGLLDKLDTQKKEIEELRTRFTTEFQNIANKLLEEKSEKFVKLNHEKVDSILKPFKERIHDFEKMVKESYENEMKDKAGLKSEIKKLMELNEVLSKDAQNLTNALKSDTKKQGNWGEVILERVLERSGLEKGSEYIVQHHTRNAEGSSIRPDVVINLPDDKHVVVDSKVSLTAYEAFVSAEDDDQKERMIKNHIQSFRNHVKQLSDKNYDTGAGLNTPDFVLLFVPIESAFSAAVQTDTDLFSYAWDKRIVIVSPSTLLATLRTVASIWKQERQNQNVQEIARLGGEIHDKLVSTMDDLKKIDEDFGRMHDRYKDSYKRLYTGKGNVIRTAKKMESLGAKSKKQINPGLLDD